MAANGWFWIGLAVVLLAIGAGLRYRGRRTRELVAERLREPDPVVRLAALRQVERDGLAVHAETLLAHLVAEQDQGVLERLRQLVRHTQWEPTSSPSVLALRQWAFTGAPALAEARPDEPGGARQGAPPSSQVRRLSAALGEELNRLVLHDDGLTVAYLQDGSTEGQDGHG